jgi:ubiquinone/menaquinone biosynthesis C-methylase UbiE
VFQPGAWHRFNIWDFSPSIRDLYRKRCLKQAEEMTCAAQAAEILTPLVKAGETLLDVGCGSGYFYHSLQSRGVPAEYYGIDATESLIRIGQECLPEFGLPKDRLITLRIEDLNASFDHVLCMNVLSNIDNYHRPLERLLLTASKSVVLRESLHDKASYGYVVDKYLDAPDALKVYVNTYPKSEVMEFIRSYGYIVEEVVDRRSGGEPEMVIDYPHYWTFLVARKKTFKQGG